MKEGVKYTEVGYAGGDMPDPEYKNMGDHTEKVQIHYDPDIVSYEELVEMFFDTQTCPHLNQSNQYRSILFYEDENEKDIILRIMEKKEKDKGEKFDTDIRPFKNFYPAEDYHQKYYFKRIRKLYHDMKEIYISEKELTMSTAVGHINGYVHGHGNNEMLKEEIHELGLTEEGKELLESFVKEFDKRKGL
ncbi:peptide-methionine (S)-S-oxide reductase [Oceanirhabdus sp. W0125-5]|uniref:peptide-methionine (S)-S-oxide reductase n=1 Tax=Oceanirhabdus sp. W0125-5 TaxID=2999116 RepID=UPI0022F316B9|nr:peptide-methionine (S)-S-oxide reductase [Oceanirhabdus sp. W0125-5]WBW99677.1 peptide-methionine (S)-S-oxide reductase [Oceanirhabdus sp. W0125-5]